ncbi:multidrug efflux SMR transporter [Micromonospora sp. R77]|uniref:DMT family transporter n=1 Tax=Micromonospora sp. R77 TaxID=2925836 RepID=UPI001F609FB9|nr:multidrug efflux SMR transporter [Micromonospora sp. R77]MCI4066225.1 multidrug efflux SMR transporter [Micromonospora sp. R77]
MAWILLVAAIVAEVVGTTALKLSSGLTRLMPSVVVAVAYLLSFVLLAFAVRHLQVSVAYAIWSGVGTATITVIGWYAFGESLTVAKVAAMLLIITGVVILNLAGAE